MGVQSVEIGYGGLSTTELSIIVIFAIYVLIGAVLKVIFHAQYLLKFKKMIAALKAEDWVLARLEATDSRWYNQTPKRAERHAKVLGGESIANVYKDLI